MDNLKIGGMNSQPILAPEHQVQVSAWLHPAVQIYIWISLALAAQMLSPPVLMLLALSVLLLALRRCASRSILLLRRTRWVLFSVFMIYAYATPGDALWPHLGVLSPVATGVEDGLVQLLRLLVVLSGLSLLLSLMSQTQMISGLYSLFRPLKYFGVPIERAVVRLALTLDYAESALRDTADNWRGRVEQMLLPVQAVPGYIELHITPFVLRDWFMLVAVTIALLGAWL